MLLLCMYKNKAIFDACQTEKQIEMLFDAKLINTLYNPTHSCYSCYGDEINDGTDNKRKLEKYLGKN